MLSCVASQFQTMLHNKRGANVQQLSFLETSLSQRNDDMWAALDDEQRTRVLGILARLIARAIAVRTAVNIAAHVEASHD
jgi:hypothetical protein